MLSSGFSFSFRKSYPLWDLYSISYGSFIYDAHKEERGGVTKFRLVLIMVANGFWGEQDRGSEP